jgi:hypothetical protein
VYLVRITGIEGRDTTGAAADGQTLTQVTGFVRTYSPEYRAFGANELLLLRLAEAGGGELLSDSTEVFVHDQEVVRTFSDMWPWLLGLALCLLPLDVGVRRVAIGFGDVRRGWENVRATWRGIVRRRTVQGQPSEERLVRLMKAKRRSPTRAETVAEIAPTESLGVEPTDEQSAAIAPAVLARPAEQAALSPVEPEQKPETAAPPSADEGSMTSRLLAAKRRARSHDQE